MFQGEGVLGLGCLRFRVFKGKDVSGFECFRVRVFRVRVFKG